MGLEKLSSFQQEFEGTTQALLTKSAAEDFSFNKLTLIF